MNEINIFAGYDFSKRTGKSAGYYLEKQESNFNAATSGILKIAVELFSLQDEKGLSYRLSIVAPKLGMYRKKILTVTEMDSHTYFPVEIQDDFGGVLRSGISEDAFLDTISEILSSANVKRSIENLYATVKEHCIDLQKQTNKA